MLADIGGLVVAKDYSRKTHFTRHAPKELLKQAREVSRLSSDAEGVAPLHKAASSGDDREVRRLLGLGTSVNIVDHRGVTPLHHAAQHGHLDALTTLLRSGAKVNALDKAQTPPLYLAVKAGHLDVVNKLLKQSADVGYAMPGGETPLLATCRRANTEALVSLLAARANPNQAGSDGVAPLQVVTAVGQTHSIWVLARAGADVNFVGGGQAPLVLAAEKGHASCVQALLHLGADEHGERAMEAAYHLGHLDVVEELAKGGVDVELVQASQLAYRARGAGRARPGGLKFCVRRDAPGGLAQTSAAAAVEEAAKFRPSCAA